MKKIKSFEERLKEDFDKFTLGEHGDLWNTKNRIIIPPSEVWSFLQDALREQKRVILKGVLRANKRYPVFANPSIGSISFEDWIKKQIKSLTLLEGDTNEK